MSYLLDTNVVSEVARSRPNPLVLKWFREVPDESLHLSVLSLGEIRKGIEMLASGPRREGLRLWLEQELPAWFEQRLLPVSAAVADRWGVLLASARRPVPAIDSLIAATAVQHGLRLVTRNTEDFRFAGLELVNPWQATG